MKVKCGSQRPYGAVKEGPHSRSQGAPRSCPGTANALLWKTMLGWHVPRPKPGSLDLERKDLLLQEHAKKQKNKAPLREEQTYHKEQKGGTRLKDKTTEDGAK